MSESQSFLGRLINGEAHITEIDDFVDKWHEGQEAVELHDYLGMTREEYSLWLLNPDMLAAICAARRKRQPIAQAVNEIIADLRETARSGNSARLETLESWLRQMGAVHG